MQYLPLKSCQASYTPPADLLRNRIIASCDNWLSRSLLGCCEGWLLAEKHSYITSHVDENGTHINQPSYGIPTI